MFVNKSKVLTIFLLSFLFIISISISWKIEGNNPLSNDNKAQIKEVIEKFIEKDYNFNGGSNDFDEIGNNLLKEYLIARNSLKEENNKSDEYIHYDNQYEFDYINFEIIKNLIKVDVDVLESFKYDIPSRKNDEAMIKNRYEIFLDKIDGEYKVVSANIDIEIDPVDGEFNVNKELGFLDEDTQHNMYKSMIKNDKYELYSSPYYKNLEKMKKRIEYIKSCIQNKYK